MIRRRRITRTRRSRRVKTRRSGVGKRSSRRRLQGVKRPLVGAAAAARAGAVALEGYIKRRRFAGRVKRTRTVQARNELSRSVKLLTLAKKSIRKDISNLLKSRLERWQGITNFDTDGGYFKLRNYQDVSNNVFMPINIFDLSCKQATGVGYQPYWIGTASTADIGMQSMTPQNTSGAAGTNQFYNEVEDDAAVIPNDECLLDWVNIRLNLYGARKRTTIFKIAFFRCIDEQSDPIDGASTHVNKKILFDELQRPLIYSNLQQRPNIQTKRVIRWIKSYTYVVAPVTSIDLNTTVGNIHEANIKLRVNSMMKYDWSSDGTADLLGHAQADGDDFIARTTASNQPRVERSKRLYMMISAFAPERSTTEALDTSIDPSYDIIIRRSVTTQA